MAMDPELKAMNSIKQSLDGLDAETRGRVLEWIGKKYQTTAVVTASGVAFDATPAVSSTVSFQGMKR